MSRAAIAVTASTFAALSLVAGHASAGKGCTEVSDIVGQTKCSHYGDFWSRERSVPVLVETGLFRDQFAPDDRSFSAAAGKNAPTVYSFHGTDLGRSVATYGWNFRILGYATPFLYTGPEWGFGFGHASYDDFRVGAVTVDRGAGLNVFSGRFSWILGTRVPLSDYTSLRVEQLVGIGVLSLTQSASGCGNDGATYNAAHTDFVLETRGILDLWTTPWSTVSVYGGVHPLHLEDRMFGLLLAFHARPFDGGRY